MKHDRKKSPVLVLLGVLGGLVVVAVYFTAVVYSPDRPVARIAPGSSSGPEFVVQIIRPRLGLPLGGILPPQLFGLEGRLTCESTSPGAYVGNVGPRRLELGADDWEMVLALDADGRVTPETHVVFPLTFEDRFRRLRCRPDDPAVGTFDTTAPGEPGEISGSFDIELARCEIADTGEVLHWPPKPLVLHGSFDRLPLGAGAISIEQER